MVDAGPVSVSQLRPIEVVAPERRLDASLRVALAHDWLVGMRGGELVLERLAQITGATDLYTMVHDRALTHAAAIEAMHIHTSALERLPGASTIVRRWYLPLYPWAVSTLHVDAGFDLLISTSSAMIKSIKAPRRGDGTRIPHICYCHSPPRYLWSMTSQYAVGAGGMLRRAGLAGAKPFLRCFDRKTSKRVDRFVANSTFTARRIKQYYGRESDVVFPPVDVDFYTPDESVQRGKHYLVVSALEPYKRVDLAIYAAQELGLDLRIAGAGSQFQYLRTIVGDETTFLGQLDRESLRREFRSARALIFPGIEDFGITPVEAMATGCPVIARNAGGALDWMAPGFGATFDNPMPRALAAAIREFETRRDGWDAKACRNNAMRFRPAAFDAGILQIIEETVS